MDNLIGKFLDNRYEILEVIGQGGMSVVYRAKCHRLNRMVAVKVLKDEFSEDAEFKNRFQDESLSVAMMSHPNIVSVYDVSKSDDIEYIVMELIDGITLKEYLQKKGHLTWQETVYFALQIAKALEHAHNRGIIHRDIKPQNIMVLRDGTVKVADFGIAHQVSKQQTYNKGEAIGSVHYISPEQAKGSRIDNRADIYSLGVVMYEMLTGRLPFEGTNPVDIAIQHINSIPLSPSDYVKDIPEAIENITMKAMSPRLSQRYSSADELIADLEKVRNDPHVKIEFNNASDVERDAKEEATRKLNYNSEIEKIKVKRMGEETRRMEPKEEEPEEKESFLSKNGGVLFNVAAILLFIGGILYFVISILNPFSTGESNALKAPDLVGKFYEDVVKNEEYSSFNIVEKQSVYDEKYTAGTIIEQTPEKGKTIEEGDTIEVVVSKGAKSETLSNLVGMEYRQAEIELEKLGIPFREEWEYSDKYSQNEIIFMTPPAGTEISEDITVVLTISKGKEIKNVKTPNVKGESESSARKILESAGLKVGNVTRVDSTEPDGTVLFQSIPAESEVQEGTSVDLQVSRYVEPKKVAKIINFPLTSYEGDFIVTVYVNGEVQYDAQHNADEGMIEIPLVAYEGSNKVKIVVGGNVALEEEMIF